MVGPQVLMRGVGLGLVRAVEWLKVTQHRSCRASTPARGDGLGGEALPCRGLDSEARDGRVRKDDLNPLVSFSGGE